MEFELKNEGYDYFEEESSELDDEVELQTPTLRRLDHVRGQLKGIVHPTFILLLFYLLMMNLDLLSMQLVLKNVNFGRKLW